ncbi:MOB-like protein phocein [Oopsacas minuta]|uniref:MOB-like protein phocein n=1 Tax=Oopsacas minuta TaxID=111878 RepID=A0AAV7JZ78_9METZ|nr:MOB-like protein phocein [Oopsacas minuta]
MAESFLRNRRGSKKEDLYLWRQYNALELDTVLTAQLYLQEMIREQPNDIDKMIECPNGVEENLWVYEHMRQICLQLNALSVHLQSCCIPTQCVNMQADGDEVYLCAVHKKPKECSAIDYILHTLDGSCSILNNTKLFPSRVTVKSGSMQRLESTARRLYRIFGHAYYRHREVFDKYESQTKMCLRFTKFALKYDLLTMDSLTIPVEISSIIKQENNNEDDVTDKN